MTRQDRFPPPVQPFVSRHQFFASLSLRDRTLDDVEVVIDVDQLGRYPPQGYFLGNNDLSKAIEALTDGRRLPRKVTLTSRAPGFAALIDVRSLSRIGPDSGPTCVVGKFDCRSATKTWVGEGEGKPRREIYFFLTGPRRDWGCWYIREPSDTGETKMDVRDYDLSLGVELPFKVEVRPYFSYSELPADDHELTAEVVSLQIYTETPHSDLSDDDFVKAAISIVDDCGLLVSFLSGAKATWYEYVLSASGRLVTHTRAVPPRTISQPDMEDSPVRREKTREFLKVAIRHLRDLRARNADPHLAIAHTISARQASSSEECFIDYFFALEALKDIHMRTAGTEKVLPDGAFKVVQSELRSALQKLATTKPDLSLGPVLALLERKLPELNRPAFWDALQGLMEEYGVEWRDMYPEDPPTQPRFISLRNTLVHTGTIGSAQVLWFETVRLAGLVERLVLRMLGWDDLVCAPRPWLHMLLRDKMGDEPLPGLGIVD